jgi:hypothetical protein
MKTETIVYCVVALILGMLMANMLKNVCGCKSNVVEGTEDTYQGLHGSVKWPCDDGDGKCSDDGDNCATYKDCKSLNCSGVVFGGGPPRMPNGEVATGQCFGTRKGTCASNPTTPGCPVIPH